MKTPLQWCQEAPQQKIFLSLLAERLLDLYRTPVKMERVVYSAPELVLPVAGFSMYSLNASSQYSCINVFFQQFIFL